MALQFLIPLCFELSRFILFILLGYGYLYWWGSINTVISFLIVASAIFVVVKLINQLKKAPAPVEEAPAEPSEEVLLLREIRDSLKNK